MIVVDVVGVSDSTLDVDMHIPRLATTHVYVSRHLVPPRGDFVFYRSSNVDLTFVVFVVVVVIVVVVVVFDWSII